MQELFVKHNRPGETPVLRTHFISTQHALPPVYSRFINDLLMWHRAPLLFLVWDEKRKCDLPSLALRTTSDAGYSVSHCALASHLGPHTAHQVLWL